MTMMHSFIPSLLTLGERFFASIILLQAYIQLESLKSLERSTVMENLINLMTITQIKDDKRITVTVTKHNKKEGRRNEAQCTEIQFTERSRRMEHQLRR